MDVFKSYIPKVPVRGILSIPHSGTFIPAPFLPFLTQNQKALACDIDTHVDQLIHKDFLLEAGVAIVISHIHRFTCDLNRPRESAILSWQENTQGEKIVIAGPTKEELEAFQRQYYDSYFQTLDELLATAYSHADDQKISCIDLHSMPSAPTAYHFKKNPNQSTSRPHICLSDLEGRSASDKFMEIATEEFLAQNLHIKKNDPYKGGHITNFLNREYTNNVQIEINRALYMNEETRELLTYEAEALKDRLTLALVNIFNAF